MAIKAIRLVYSPRGTPLIEASREQELEVSKDGHGVVRRHGDGSSTLYPWSNIVEIQYTSSQKEKR